MVGPCSWLRATIGILSVQTGIGKEAKWLVLLLLLLRTLTHAEALTTAEHNQAMGHRPGAHTYEQYYLPNLIERDFQSIYFGTTSQDELVQHVARMGISRDERAPIGLSDT